MHSTYTALHVLLFFLSTSSLFGFVLVPTLATCTRHYRRSTDTRLITITEKIIPLSKMLAIATASLLLASTAFAQSTTTFPEGVVATGTMGVTNPPEPTTGTAINQTSFSRLLSINSVDDWCIFAPPESQDIADSETIEVAWCTQQRNDARVIPDGTISGVSLLKTGSFFSLYFLIVKIDFVVL